MAHRDVTFALISVPQHTMTSPMSAEYTMRCVKRKNFPRTPVVLVTWDDSGAARFYGRDDLVEFLARNPETSVDWQPVTI